MTWSNPMVLAAMGLLLFELAPLRPGPAPALPAARPMGPATPACTGIRSLPIDEPTEAHLAALAAYQDLCGSFVTDRLMIFLPMPGDSVEAVEMASHLEGLLLEFAEVGVAPIVVVEPTTLSGMIGFSDFAEGAHSEVLHTYFRTLRSTGLTDDEMGMWVPFPEPNVPEWDRQGATPETVGRIINMYLGILKSYFPRVRAGILLDSFSYEEDDVGWTRGEKRSLLPYLREIDRGLVDSFGIQGFPWSPPSGAGRSGIEEPSEYLAPELVVEAARSLGIRSVWFNTGTFRTKYAGDPDRRVEWSPAKRMRLLCETLSVGRRLEREGFEVWINLFAADKSEAEEATDWSYVSHGDVDVHDHPGHGRVFADFVRAASNLDMEVAMFERVPDDVGGGASRGTVGPTTTLADPHDAPSPSCDSPSCASSPCDGP